MTDTVDKNLYFAATKVTDFIDEPLAKMRENIQGYLDNIEGLQYTQELHNAQLIAVRGLLKRFLKLWGNMDDMDDRARMDFARNILGEVHSITQMDREAFSEWRAQAGPMYDK